MPSSASLWKLIDFRAKWVSPAFHEEGQEAQNKKITLDKDEHGLPVLPDNEDEYTRVELDSIVRQFISGYYGRWKLNPSKESQR